MTTRHIKTSLILAFASFCLVHVAVASAEEAAKPLSKGAAPAAGAPAATVPDMPAVEPVEEAAPPTPEGKKALTPQQAKMSACSKDAKGQGLKGADRKAFMKDCLKKK